jgi:uroporphyrinogen-III decarboxylase
MDLVRSWAGIEAFAYAIYDFPDKVEALLGAASESYRRMYEMVCDLTPALILVLWDDATTGLLSRSLFERYSVPALKAFAQAAHSRGKILVNHTCGPIRAFADLYVEARQDAVDWLALPPTGDMMPSAVRELWNGKVTPMYAPDPQTVRFAAPETLLGYMKCMLDEADLSNAIVLLPCPQGTPVENARVMACYLSARCGSRFSPTL